MLTSVTDARLAPLPKDDRAAYRTYAVTVARVERLSEHFVRVTLSGDELEFFGRSGLDQRIKLLFPTVGVGGAPAFGDVGAGVDAADRESQLSGDWYARWRALPENERNPFRTYTVRAIRPAERELDVDFVEHSAHDGAPAGPAAAWLARARVGDPLIVAGPDERSANAHQGLDWHPGDARRVLLIGDETAVPAVASILASLAPSIRVDALLEVPTAGDRRQLPTDAEARIQWLPREGAEHGSLLEPAVRAWLAASADAYRGVVVPTEQELAEIDVDRETLWDSPVLAGIDEVADAGFYAWIAGESAVIKTLRRVLVTEHRIDRHRVAFMGYWRQGQSEKQG